MHFREAVVDTNVIVSGTIQESGYPFRVLNAWRDGIFLLVVSEPVVAEVERVLHYPKIRKKYGLTERQISDVIGCLRKYGLMTPGTLDVQVVKEDPDDDKFIQSALEGEADYIVSGDEQWERTLCPRAGQYSSLRLPFSCRFGRL